MSEGITLDGDRILLDGEEVGRHSYAGGRSTVTLNLSFETTSDEWIVPITLLARGLKTLPEFQEIKPVVLLEIETDEDDVEVLDGVMRRLEEKTLKGNGYTWRFHKSDKDDFPSPLHGHDYERHLKVDAIDGRIYEMPHKRHCETLKPRALLDVQSKLRASRDFVEKVRTLIGPDPD